VSHPAGEPRERLLDEVFGHRSVASQEKRESDALRSVPDEKVAQPAALERALVGHLDGHHFALFPHEYRRRATLGTLHPPQGAFSAGRIGPSAASTNQMSGGAA